MSSQRDPTESRAARRWPAAPWPAGGLLGGRRRPRPRAPSRAAPGRRRRRRRRAGRAERRHATSWPPGTRSPCSRPATASAGARSTTPSAAARWSRSAASGSDPGQDRILARARELGIGTFKTWTRGEQIFDYRGHQTHFSGLIPPLPEPDAERLRPAAGQGHRRPVAGSPPRRHGGRRARPGSMPRRSRPTSWPTRTTPGARFLLDLAVKAVFAAEPRDLSLLHALFYLQRRQRDPVSHRHRRRRAGLALSRRLAAGQHPAGQAAGPPGGAGRAGAPHRPGRRRGHRGQRRRHLAGQARDHRHLARCWPGASTTSRRSGALRDGLTQRVPQGSVIKYEAVYPHAVLALGAG